MIGEVEVITIPLHHRRGEEAPVLVQVSVQVSAQASGHQRRKPAATTIITVAEVAIGRVTAAAERRRTIEKAINQRRDKREGIIISDNYNDALMFVCLF
jgi:hypothetical protein